MARPSISSYEGREARWRWEILLEAQSRSGFSSEQMAELLGLTSGGSYRKFKKQNRVPIEAWERFETVKGSFRNIEERIDLVNEVTALINEGYEGFVYINTHAEAVHYDGDVRHCKDCGKKFIHNSWNHWYCHNPCYP